MLTSLLLFLAAMLAGAMNALAGGGTFIVFPSLIFAGIPPIMANATATVTVWPGSVASAFGYRRELKQEKENFRTLLAVSLVGSLGGALILLHTPERVFRFLIPWLLLGATLLFTFGKHILARIHLAMAKHPRRGSWQKIVAPIMQFFTAIYGGYFGAGMGILMLAMLELSGMSHIHRMNAVKAVLGSLINLIAVVTFIAAGIVSWQHAPAMIAGATIGGYFGAHYGRLLPQTWVRRAVTAVGSVLTVYFFLS